MDLGALHYKENYCVGCDGLMTIMAYWEAMCRLQIRKIENPHPLYQVATSMSGTHSHHSSAQSLLCTIIVKYTTSLTAAVMHVHVVIIATNHLLYLV